MSTHPWIQKFLTSQKARSAPSTVTWYRRLLTAWQEWAEAQGIAIKNATIDDLELYIAYLRQPASLYTGHPLRPVENRSRSPSTIRAHVRALKTFYKWCHSRKLLDHNPAADLRGPRKTKKQYPRWTPEQVETFITAAANANEGLGPRDKALVLLLIDTGMRVGELCATHREDVHFDEVNGYGWIENVVGKSKDPRRVIFKGRTMEALIEYRQGLPATGPLFLSKRGDALTETGVWKLLDRAAERAGLSHIAHNPHAFRHLFCTEFVARGGNQFALQKLAGHADLSTTAIYVQPLSFEDLLELHTSMVA